MNCPSGFASRRIPGCDRLNASLIRGFQRERAAGTTRQSHFFHGRPENLYVPRARLPEIEPLLEHAVTLAAGLTGVNDLKLGFWFNAMGPGHLTTRHAHQELDELLSCVYYLVCPENSGRLVLHGAHGRHFVDPQPGLLVCFPPDLEHEVELNRSPEERLSVAINFGPA